MLAGHRVDAFHGRQYTMLLAIVAHFKIGLLHAALGFQHEACYLEIAESGGFHFTEEIIAKFIQRIVRLQFKFEVHDVLQTFQEPFVYFGKCLDALHTVAFFQRLGNGKNAQVGGILQLLFHIVEMDVFVTHKAMHALPYHAETFLYHFLETASDAHDFAHRLHAGTYQAAHSGKLGQVPTRYFANHIVQARSHIGRVGRSHLANLVQSIAQGYLCCHECQRIARGFRCQCRRTAQAGVHFYDAVIVGLGVEGKLDVTFAYNVQMAHTLYGKLLQHLHLLIGQRAGRGHHDRLARMDAQRVKVFHRSHRKAMVIGVADDFKLYLFPPFQRFFHQYLRSKREGTLGYFAERLFIRTDAAAQTAQGICRTYHHGIAQRLSGGKCVVHGFHGPAARGLQVGSVQFLHEQVAVFRIHNGLHTGAQHLHAILLEHPRAVQFSATVQCRLSAESQQNAVGTLFLNDFSNKMRGHGQEIHRVGNTLARLDSRNVGINQHRADAFFTQGFQCLRTGIIKLTGLANFQGAGTKNQYFF